MKEKITMPIWIGHPNPVTATVVMTAGKLDRKAKVVFTRGHCHSLALAVHKLTGWQIYGLADDEGDYIHIMVKTPKGYLDVMGLEADRRWMNLWKVEFTIKSIDPSMISHLDGFMRPQTKKANTFAVSLIKKYFPKLL